jgi:hypothetical protein
MSGPGNDNEFSKQSSEMKIPSQYDNRDWGKATKIVKRKVTTKDSGDPSKEYGSKAIMTKEEHKPSFTDFLLGEGSDISTLPDSVIAEIKKNIRTGAKDLVQKWKNALELLHKAYQVANVRRPTPDQKGAWKQYNDLIQFAVRQLVATRGLDGEWRTSQILVREDMEQNHIGSKRFFVEIPGERAQEVDGKNMDEIIDAISNKIRNSKHVTGTKVRVEERSKEHAILTVWVNDIKRERIVIKQVS